MSGTYLGGGLAWAILLLATASAGGARAQTGEAAPAIPVLTAAVESRPVSAGLTVTGRIAAIDRAEIRARVDGFVEEVAFTEGSTVRVGDLLYRIEQDQFQADVQAAQGALDQRRAEKSLADVQLARAQQLMESNTGTVVARDQAKAESDRSAGAVVTAEAQLATAQIKLGYTEISSPIAGRIGRTAVTKGAVVGPSSGVLATVVSQDPMYVIFPVSARELLRRDQNGKPINPADVRVILQFPDGSTYSHEGHIDFVDVTVDPSTDSVQARSTIANPDRTLIDGQLVTVLLRGDKPVERLVIPQTALIADQGGVYVFVVQDGKAVVRRIRPGEDVGPDVSVLDGLAAGEQVIVAGIERLRPGAAVLASPAPTAPAAD